MIKTKFKRPNNLKILTQLPFKKEADQQISISI